MFFKPPNLPLAFFLPNSFLTEYLGLPLGSENEFLTEPAKSCQSGPLGVWDAQALLITPLERRERSILVRPAFFDDFGAAEAETI